MLRRSQKAQIAADLRTAARMIERYGWTRDPYPLAGGVMGASLAAAMCLARFGRWPEARGKQLRLQDPRYRRMYETMLRRVQAEHAISICEWNGCARSGEDVIHAVRSVADHLDPVPALPLIPVYADAIERRRAYRGALIARGEDITDLPPLGDGLVVEVPDAIPVEWLGVR
jgi:hypothetical protein